MAADSISAPNHLTNALSNAFDILHGLAPEFGRLCLCYPILSYFHLFSEPPAAATGFAKWSPALLDAAPPSASPSLCPAPSAPGLTRCDCCASSRKEPTVVHDLLLLPQSHAAVHKLPVLVHLEHALSHVTFRARLHLFDEIVAVGPVTLR